MLMEVTIILSHAFSVDVYGGCNFYDNNPNASHISSYSTKYNVHTYTEQRRQISRQQTQAYSILRSPLLGELYFYNDPSA